MRYFVMGAAVACLAAPALAADADRTVTRRLQQQLQVDPDDPVVMARLARMYLVSGSPDRARGLYRGLLSLEDVLLERSGGVPMSSHALARRGLKALDAPMPVRLGSR